MKKIVHPVIILALSFGLFSCEGLFDTEDGGLTREEVVEGLKTALEVGTDSAVSVTSAMGGYLEDEAIKILLPDEVETAMNYADDIGVAGIIEPLVDDVILSVNRAAEHAAPKARQPFNDAIRGLSISQAWEILNGINPAGSKKNTQDFDSTAATNYLKAITFTQLVDAFSPDINDALDKDLGLGFTATGAWNSLTGTYNDAAVFYNGTAALWPGVDPVETIDTDLGEYAVGKALDGLFLKVGEEEKKIRDNPFEWATSTVGDILTKVFGD